jgi:HSP20 family protein
MAIVRWDPFRDLVTLRDRMNRLFEDVMPGREEGTDVALAAWAPSVDIRETDKALIVTAELPGVDEKDIEVSVENHTLTLRGKREMEKETKREDYHRIERSYGSFYRAFSLPASVDVDKIEAKHEDGLLRITVPKKPELKPKKVKVLKGGKSEK